METDRQKGVMDEGFKAIGLGLLKFLILWGALSVVTIIVGVVLTVYSMGFWNG